MPPNAPDAAMVLFDGPWEHRFVAANGARFHVAEQGDGPLVLLLHGFPQFWWAWRHQLPALVDAGYRVAALDLRGYGASDKPPRGYDTPTLAADVAGVVRSLGEQRAVVAGQGWGGWLAWSMPALQPRVTRAVAALSAPHPLRLRRAMLTSAGQRRAMSHVLGFQRPVLPERRLARDASVVPRLLSGWSAPGWPSHDEATTYATAMRVPFVAHSAMEGYRWAFRSLARRDGREYVARVARPVDVPVLHLQGAQDTLVLPSSARGSGRLVTGPYRYEEVADAGHFLTEERPDEVTRLMTGWLAGLDASD